MAIVYSCDVLELLKDRGFSSYRLRKEKLISQGAVQRIREGKMISWHELDKICTWLQCQPGDLLRHEVEVNESDPE